MQQWRTYVGFLVLISVLFTSTSSVVLGATTKPDTDHDGLPDAWETILGTDSNTADTDGDTYPDGLEIQNSYDPLNPNPIKKEKLIKVSIREQKLRYFFDGKLLEEFAVSTGLKQTPTPLGNFSILKKRPVVHYKGTLLGKKYNYPNTKWNMAFKTERSGISYYIHGAYWHNEFGKRRSAGCVNVRYQDMEMLYAFTQLGTKVVIE